MPEQDLPILDSSFEEALAEANAHAPAQKGPLAFVRRYHPLLFLGFSAVLACTAVAVYPDKSMLEPPTLEELHTDGRKALRAVKSLHGDEDARLRQLRQAWVSFDDMIRYRNKEIGTTSELVNPYLLFAEAARLYAEEEPIRAKELTEQAIWGYTKALEWETRERDEDERRAYGRQFFPIPVDIDDDELAVRQRRREEYIQFWRAILRREAGRASLSLQDLEALQKDLRGRTLQQTESVLPREATAVALADALPEDEAAYPPQPYELVQEDRLAIRYHLGRALEDQRQFEDAERQYAAFLLQAPRGSMRYDALLRLGRLQAERGRAALAQMVQQAGSSDELLRQAQTSLQAAADRFGQIVEASPAEDLLREAYFRGGAALLDLARTLDGNRTTWWDDISDAGAAVEDALAGFVRSGWRLPEESRRLPAALGEALLEKGVEAPSVLSSFAAGTAGSLLNLSTRPRQTPRARRQALLQQARRCFEGAEGGRDGRLNGWARVMIAQTLLAEDQTELARQLFARTRIDFGGDEIDIACRLGTARSYFREGDLESCRRRLLGGVEQRGETLLTENEIQWRDLCLRLDREGTSGPGPVRRVWELLDPPARAAVRHVAQMFKIEPGHRKLILSGLNRMLQRSDFYRAEDFDGLVLPVFARQLLERDRVDLPGRELQWLNRMLLESGFPHEIARSEIGVAFEPLPPSEALPAGMLVDPREVVADLLQLSRAYRERAEQARQDQDRLRETGGRSGRVSAAGTPGEDPSLRRRRNLMHAAEVNEFLLARYVPDSAPVLATMAELYRELAEVVGASPFLERERAAELIARAARSHLRAADASMPGSAAEEEALWSAGWSFYQAGQRGRASEALALYLARHGDSDRAGAAANLLGRAYRDMGRYEDAIRTFRDNAERLTPDGRKSLFYLGWVYAEMGSRPGAEAGADGQTPEADLLGNPDMPLPSVKKDGLVDVQSALQAFNRLRRLQGLGWESRPWRWATFGLGQVWYRIGERARAAAQAAGEVQNASAPPAWMAHYRMAESVLRESLDRYLLRRTPQDELGLDWRTEPEDYGEALAARFLSEYYLARTRLILAQAENDLERRAAAQEGLRRLLRSDLYPDVLFDPALPAPRFVTWARVHGGAEATTDSPRRTTIASVLGETEGPEYSPHLLAELRRNAYFVLGQSLYEQGRQQLIEARGLTDPARLAERDELQRRARQALEAARDVYQNAFDRLPAFDAPQVLYLMGECLREMAEPVRAIERYRLAQSTARNLPQEARPSDALLAPAFWEELAAQRLRELEADATPQ